jgi:hypothetical protein
MLFFLGGAMLQCCMSSFGAHVHTYCHAATSCTTLSSLLCRLQQVMKQKHCVEGRCKLS